MGKRHQERRTDRASADDVAEIERQLWEFARRPDPPEVPEAKLRPGAFLYRVHRVWHSLGRGTGLASHSFRALKDELMQRDPPVRNLQPKLYGATALSLADASHLIDVMLETWHVARGKSLEWKATALPRLAEARRQPADAHDLDVIRENLLHTLFRGDDSLLLEEPIGVPPEIFMEERGRSSLALIIPTKKETIAHLSPTNLYGGFSSLLTFFFDAAAQRYSSGESMPILIWVLKLGSIRDNAEFHEAFHALASYSACLTNWYFRLSRRRGTEKKGAQSYWDMIVHHSAFAVYGLPLRTKDRRNSKILVDEDLADIEPNFFLPESLPIALGNHRQVRKHREQLFSFNVSVEADNESVRPRDRKLNYWLLPDRPKEGLEETAETTGLPVFDAEMSPGSDFDLAFHAIYEAAMYHLGFSTDARAGLHRDTLEEMGWQILTIDEFQNTLLISKNLSHEPS